MAPPRPIGGHYRPIPTRWLSSRRICTNRRLPRQRHRRRLVRTPAHRPVGSTLRDRPFGPIGSLLLHLLPLLLLIDWPMRPPAEIAPIPVQLVVEPPPAPKPASKPNPKPAPAPPTGRLASDDIGDTLAKGHDAADSREPEPGNAPPASEPAPAETPKKTAEIIPPPAASDALAPPLPPPPKPKPTPQQPLRHGEGRPHLVLRPARFPGPAATRDEYLAYLATLTRQHIGLLPLGVVAGRRGETVIDILVLDNGTVAMLKVGRSSGYPDIDGRIEKMIAAVGRFPPLPQWFQGPSMQLEFRLKFPEALEN